MKVKKILAFIAALSMLSVTGVNAFAEESVTDETEAVVATTAELTTEETSETEVIEENTESEEDSEIQEENEEESESDGEDTEVESNIVGDSNTDEESKASVNTIISLDNTKKTFTIGDETFTASVLNTFRTLTIVNSKGEAFLKDLWDGDQVTESASLSVNGNIITISEYDSEGRLRRERSIEYNSSTGKFGELIYNNGGNMDDPYYFDIDDISFYAEFVPYNEIPSNAPHGSEYITIYFADGTKTNIQNEFVYLDKLMTNGYPYCTGTHISVSGNKLTIRYVDASQDASKDILKTYTFDKASNSFILQGTEGKPSDNNSTESSTNNTTANSPATGDTMAIPAVAGSAIIVLGAVICVSKKKK